MEIEHADAIGLELTEPHSRSAEEVVSALATDVKGGLTEAQARLRLERCGHNQLTVEEPVPVWRKFLGQFRDVLVLLLIAAALISGALWLIERDSAFPYEAIAILGIVVLNAVMGYVQQARADSAVAALRQMSAPQATVVRDGTRSRIASSLIVPGDIVLMEEGDTIPADARVIEAATLQAAEASLTGESLPVSKNPSVLPMVTPLGDRRNMLFGGTAVVRGRGLAVVTATGMRTEMGRIAGMLEATTNEDTPLQKELDRVGRLLGVVVVAIAVAMVGSILLVSNISDVSALFDVLILGVALAVAAVPEGLPAIVTAVLSMGVQRMAKRNAIVRHLAAVETLGSADVIASDKTGTLTRNEMTVRRIVTASGHIDLGGTGYSPEGEVRPALDGAAGSALRSEVVRALAAADRANCRLALNSENVLAMISNGHAGT